MVVVLQIVDDDFELGAHLGEHLLRLLDGGQHLGLHFAGQRFHALTALAHGEVHGQQDAGLQQDGDPGQGDEHCQLCP